jgi:hypothetical protein
MARMVRLVSRKANAMNRVAVTSWMLAHTSTFGQTYVYLKAPNINQIIPELIEHKSEKSQLQYFELVSPKVQLRYLAQKA